MSGYLEVKYPFKSNLGLNPFKSWKRQWCILRPSPTSSGGSLAVYCSEAGAAAGTVALSTGCVVKRAKSRSRPFAFAVFPTEEPRKPRVLLAAPSLPEAHAWMDKIKAVLNGDKLLGTESLLKESFSVKVITTDLSKKCSVDDSTVVTVSTAGLQLSPSMLVEWNHVSDVLLTSDSTDNRLCVVCVDSGFLGGGKLQLGGSECAALAGALRARGHCGRTRSLADLTHTSDTREPSRGSWYSGPSEASLDDMELGNTKEWLSGEPRARLHSAPAHIGGQCSSDRRSLASIASGIYEEIPDLPGVDVTDSPDPRPDDSVTEPDGAMPDLDESVPEREDSVSGPDDPDSPREIRDTSGDLDGVYCPMFRLAPPRLAEPMYESVAECVYGTRRRAPRRPPPLPPRCTKPGVTRHGSLGALTHAHTLPPHHTNTNKKQPFSVFRKRLKSDSLIATSPKSETKENKDIETKKKRFEFTPTRDIFKNFKVSRKLKNLKITGNLDAPLETKSCEFLDETDHVEPNRSSRSVECLDEDYYNDELELQLNEPAATLALPQEIVSWLVLRRQPPPPLMIPPHDHYIAMAPKAPRA